MKSIVIHIGSIMVCCTCAGSLVGAGAYMAAGMSVGFVVVNAMFLLRTLLRVDPESNEVPRA